MFFIIYKVLPRKGSPHHAGGAYATCWMDLKTLQAAKTKARSMLREDGWRISRLDQAKPIERENVPRQSLPYYEQALIDKTVLVLHTWPVRRRPSLKSPLEPPPGIG